MRHTLHYRLHEVASYINWLYFFHAWGFPARYGAISRIHGCESCWQNWLHSFPTDEQHKAAEAVSLMREAQRTLNEMDALWRTHAIIGLYPASGQGEDIVLRTDDGGTLPLPMLRQQTGRECLCLSDFVGQDDTVGLFVATVDRGLEESYPDDPFRHMVCQTLADRLAEATAERAHEQARRTLWGYAPHEDLTLDELFREAYQGKRPAVGYPSMPDQSINFVLDEALHMADVGVTLTQSGAMMPHASTSGLMISHPRARHFAVGKIGMDQLADYAARRGMSIERTKQFLISNIIEE